MPGIDTISFILNIVVNSQIPIGIQSLHSPSRYSHRINHRKNCNRSPHWTARVTVQCQCSSVEVSKAPTGTKRGEEGKHAQNKGERACQRQHVGKPHVTHCREEEAEDETDAADRKQEPRRNGNCCSHDMPAFSTPRAPRR